MNTTTTTTSIELDQRQKWLLKKQAYTILMILFFGFGTIYLDRKRISTFEFPATTLLLLFSQQAEDVNNTSRHPPPRITTIDDDAFVFSESMKVRTITKQQQQQQQQHGNTAIINTTTQRDMNKMIFIHVGKSGGQSVKYALRAGCRAFAHKPTRDECFEALPDSELSNRVQYYTHVRKIAPRLPPRNENNNNNNKKPKQSPNMITNITATTNHTEILMSILPPTPAPEENNVNDDDDNDDRLDGYLMVLRHPVQRAISWYRVTNPGDCPITTAKLTAITSNCGVQIYLNRHRGGATDEFFKCVPKLNRLETLWNIATNSIITSAVNNTISTTNTSPPNSLPSQQQKEKQLERKRKRKELLQKQQDYCRAIVEDVFRFSHLNYTMETEKPFTHMIWNIERYVQFISMMPNNNNNKKKKKKKMTPTTTVNDRDNQEENQQQQDQQSPPRPKYPVYIVRTEHLWEDLGDIDRSLGGKGTFGQVEGLQVTHREKEKSSTDNTTTTTSTSNTTALSSSSSSSPPPFLLSLATRKRLCCFLQSELIWYRNLLAWSENLSIQQAKETWQEAVEYCGESSWDRFVEQCNDAAVAAVVMR